MYHFTFYPVMNGRSKRLEALSARQHSLPPMHLPVGASLQDALAQNDVAASRGNSLAPFTTLSPKVCIIVYNL